MPEFNSDGTPVLKAVYAPPQGEEGPSEFYGWQVPYTSKRSYEIVTVGDDTEPRKETYLDLRDRKPSCDDMWPREILQGGTADSPPPIPALKETYDAFAQSLHDQGVQHLQDNYGVVTNLDTGTINTAAYLRDWDLGDLVELSVSTVGLQAQARIIEVNETYDENGISISCTIGDKKIGIIEKARLA